MKYIAVGDIHLNHPRTPTLHICNSFRKHILNEKNKDLDVLFIEGDLFDGLMDLTSKEFPVVLTFFNDLLNYCYFNNIKLRVLYGTPSHDRSQPEILVNLNDIRDNKADLRYFKVLDIEYLPEENKHVLYIPDEWVNDHSELERQIEEKLSSLGISQVDIAILHGQFKYQFKDIPYTGFYFKEEYFLPLVKGFIHVGHYHTYNPFDRILPAGSFERLSHGEEESKGFILVKDNEYTFIHNTDAYTYKTITIKSNTTLEQLDKHIRQCPLNSHIRIVLSKTHPFNLTFGDLKLRYMDYNITKKTKDDSESSLTTYIQPDDILYQDNPFTIDADIGSIVLRCILEKTTLTDQENIKLKNYLSVFNQTTVNHSENSL